MMKRTKIVATIGPATETPEILQEMMEAGMNVARFNTKHSDPEWHNERIQRVKDVAKKINHPVAVLLDLQGPEIRINLPEQKAFEVKAGEMVTITADTSMQGEKIILVPEDVITSLETENLILLADGSCEFIVKEKTTTVITAEAIVDCKVEHRKTMNTPGVILDMPSLTDRDYLYLDGVNPELVDFVGLSFVRNAQDVDILRKELDKRGFTAHIVAKIENQAALDHLSELIETSDAVMVARGDLGVEVPYEELIYWQKRIIDECRIAGKPVITATEMLKSMVSKPRPTRAEVSDVAHAIYDGTDAVMLSDETTIGLYPVKAIKVQAKISQFNEKFAKVPLPETKQTDTTSNIALAAVQMILKSDITIDKVVCLTETGRTARLISRFRLPVPVMTATSNEHTFRQLTLLYGVQPCIIKLPEDRIEHTEELLDMFVKEEVVKSGETILLVSGTIWKKPGLTNTLSLISIP